MYDFDIGEEFWFVSGNIFEMIFILVVVYGFIFCFLGCVGLILVICLGGCGDVIEMYVVWFLFKGLFFVLVLIVVGDYFFMVNDMVSIVMVYEVCFGEVVW